MAAADISLQQRLAELEALLLAHQLLWQAQPFKQARPAWCAQYPELSAALLALDELQLQQLGRDPAPLQQLLARHLPSMAPLAGLCALPPSACQQAPEPGPHLANHIPGRKWQQIRAFAAVLPAGSQPLLEWCGGKVLLGRLLAWQHRQPVLTLELNPELCQQGGQLANRHGLVQHFRPLDVLSPEAGQYLAGRHVVALHACGALHRHLLHEAVAQQVEALDLAPCCYHHLLAGDYQALSRNRQLSLRRDDVRLAVTGAFTAPARELRWRDREMAWKLGFLLLREQAGKGYRPIRPIDKGWLRGDFAAFCRQLAARDGEPLPASPDWDKLEQLGWQRQRDTMRLSLLRQGFRRAIELWLVLDMACYLGQHGYRVRVEEFCAPPLTPRNLLLSARLR